MCVLLCIWVSVNQGFVCAITFQQFKQEMLNSLVKIPGVFWVDWHWSSRPNWTKRKTNTKFWAYPRDKSLKIEGWISELGPKMYLSTFKIPVDFVFRCSWPSVLFMILNPVFASPNFASLIYMRRFYIFSVTFASKTYPWLSSQTTIFGSMWRSWNHRWCDTGNAIEEHWDLHRRRRDILNRWAHFFENY